MSAMGYRNIGFRFAPEVQKLGVTGVFFTVGALRNRQRDPEFDSLFDSEIQWLLASGQPESLVQDPMWITKTFDASAARTTVTAGGALLATEPGDTTAALFGAAVDIGTTTITSGILATKLAEQRGVTLFVDIGTNGEMVLAANGQLTATSTAAGPAFEGMNIACGMRASRGAIEQVSLSGNDVEIKTIANAEPVGLCGSGLLDVVGELAAHGGVDKNGRFQTHGSLPDRQWKDQFGSLDGKPVFRIADPLYLSQKDVRQVQLAKAAVRAGIELLLRSHGLVAAQVDRVLIAGSGGDHLRTASLIHLGLLP